MNVTNATGNDTVKAIEFNVVGGNWNFIGKEFFVVCSTCTLIINITAFVVIYKSQRSFDSNGFWEQLLALCVSDTLLGFGILLVTLSQFETFHNSFFGTVSGVVYAICQISSLGNILGISIQRFISLRKAGERHQSWTQKHTILYCTGNFTVMLILLAIYFVLISRIPPTYAQMAFIIEASTVTAVIDVFCFLTLYYLNKNLKRVGAMNVQRGGNITGQAPGTQSRAQIREEHTVCTVVESDNAGKGSNVSKTETVSHGNTASDECSIIGNSDVQFVEKCQDSTPNKLPGTSMQSSLNALNEVNVGIGNVSVQTKRQEPQMIPEQPNRNAKINRFGRYQRDAVLTVALIVLLLNVFSLVPAAASILSRFDTDSDNVKVYRALVLTYSFNSLVNPIVYVFRMKFLKARIARTFNELFARFRCPCSRA